MLLEQKRRLLRKMREKLEEEKVFVEGKKDAKAVEKAFGVKAMAVEGNHSYRFAEKHASAVNGNTVLLLFDFDEEGKRKTREYEEALRARGARIDGQGRKAFRALFRLATLEELPAALADLEKMGVIENGKDVRGYSKVLD